jgi:TetR/AcrR family transcriptional regulator
MTSTVQLNSRAASSRVLPRPPADKHRRPETVSRILATAERIFAEKGLAGARTDEIARAARVNKALLYYYFKSKDELYGAVVRSLFQGLQDVIETAAGSDVSYRDRITAFVNGYFAFVIAHPNYPRIVQREMMNASEANKVRIVRKYRLPTFRRLQQLIHEGIRAGEFNPLDSEQTVFSIIGMTVFYFATAPVLSSVLGRNMLSSRAIEERRRALLDFLSRGLFKTSAGKP